MSVAYIRKSNKDFDKIVDDLKKAAEKADFKVIGEIDLPEVKGKSVSICKAEWMERLLQEESQLMGFLPCSVSIFKKKMAM